MDKLAGGKERDFCEVKTRRWLEALWNALPSPSSWLSPKWHHLLFCVCSHNNWHLHVGNVTRIDTEAHPHDKSSIPWGPTEKMRSRRKGPFPLVDSRENILRVQQILKNCGSTLSLQGIYIFHIYEQFIN